MQLRYIFIIILFLKSSTIFAQDENFVKDSLKVDHFNKAGFEIRLTNPEKTLAFGKTALKVAEKAEYQNGLAEAYRIIGIGYYYRDRTDSAMTNYLLSLSAFKQNNNIIGQARVYNNIGNLYREIDHNEGLKYFQKSLKLAEEANITDLIGSTYVNIGIIYFRKELFSQALVNFDRGLEIFQKLDNQIGIINSLQNKGVVYYELKHSRKAEEILLEAKRRAKEQNLSKVIASIDLTLVDIYISQKDFEKAESARNEGLLYSRLLKNKKLEKDYLLLSYQLEATRKNYKEALHYLKTVYTLDSAAFNNVESDKIGLLDAQFKSLQKEQESRIIIEREKTNKVLLIAAIIVSILAFIVIFLLFNDVKKKNKTNKQLNTLNEEISLQKELLNEVNHNLEQIIDERTKDLRIKNRKLSEYSSHLSHHIRGPVATMKGLLMLEKEALIEDKEFIYEMDKCVNEIDERIVNMNDNLNNLSESGLIPKLSERENEV
jgi:tetratricopeptide (TPR) repeat protein